MSKNLHLSDRPDGSLSETYLHLEDEVLGPIWELGAREQLSAAWSLFKDPYGDASFDAPTAARLAEECTYLATKAEPIVAVWLRIIAAFAASASQCDLHVVASAD